MTPTSAGADNGTIVFGGFELWAGEETHPRFGQYPEEAVPKHSTFSKNRYGRCRDSDAFRHLFETVLPCRA